MEIRLVIFLAFTSVTLIMNTLLILFAYKAFAKFATNLTETIREFETNSTTREWVASLQSASEQAVSVTGTAKQRFVEYDSVMHDAQVRYEFALAKLDTRMAEFRKEDAQVYKGNQRQGRGARSQDRRCRCRYPGRCREIVPEEE